MALVSHRDGKVQIALSEIGDGTMTLPQETARVCLIYPKLTDPLGVYTKRVAAATLF